MDFPTMMAAITERAGQVPPLGKTLRLDFGDQQYYVDGTGAANVVSESDGDADCVVSITRENFLALASGELNPMMAIMTGKVKIKGDMSVAMKLQSLLDG